MLKIKIHTHASVLCLLSLYVDTENFSLLSSDLFSWKDKGTAICSDFFRLSFSYVKTPSNIQGSEIGIVLLYCCSWHHERTPGVCPGPGSPSICSNHQDRHVSEVHD